MRMRYRLRRERAGGPENVLTQRPACSRSALLLRTKGWLTGVVLLTLLCVLLSMSPASAWGPDGHRIVAEIAQHHLKPKTRQRLQSEFNIKNLASVANWADRIKDQRKETRPWHYTNIKAGKRTYKKSRDCPDHHCVIEKIREFERFWKDTTHSQKERSEALKFLVHFVADVHQPLHLGNKIDRGGNDILIGHGKNRVKLHALWDHAFIHLDGKTLLQYAAEQAGDITPDTARLWAHAPIDAWANESRALALEKAYPVMLEKNKKLSPDYINRSRRVVRLQLQKAGIRLAYLLNAGSR